MENYIIYPHYGHISVRIISIKYEIGKALNEGEGIGECVRNG